MKAAKARRPSPALIVSIIALIVATAGTATAATIVVRNSGQIKNGAVKSVDLANGKGVKVADLTRGARTSLRGQQGPRGEQGAQGPAGAQGAPGAPGAVSKTVTRLTTVTLANGGAGSPSVQCQSGEKLVGGGARLGNTDVDTSDLHLHSSRPATATGTPPAEGETATGWRAFAWNVAGGPNGDIEMSVYAICAT